MKLGSLFSGIGGFELGLERAGMTLRWQSEIDPYASAVLRKHWPDVPNHGDIRNVRAGAVEPVDVICGGFPCQDISNAGKRAGIDGERSGLWSEYARVIGELRPRYVLVENVAALLGRGLERVLGDLAALGFDAEWHCVPASAVGAPHRRDRVWIVAHARRERFEQHGERDRAPAQAIDCACRDNAGRCGAHVADADESRLEGRLRSRLFNSAGECLARSGGPRGLEWTWWFVEPDVGRVAHGVRSRVDRLRCLGNAIVPQVAEVIGRAVMATA
jgi:DNA (cytosine-5)-methyltransferase 1